MKSAFFAAAVVAGIVIIFLSLLAHISGRFRFWPPPSEKSWQYYTFWWLFRVLVLGVVIVGILDYDGLGVQSGVVRYVIGLPLALAGFAIAFYASFYLGWKNAHGEVEGLKTEGIYKISRNPVYVVSIIGFIGLGLVINSMRAYVLLALWAGLYVIAPLLEEPWLEAQYGEAFVAYKAQVPRFVGLRRK